MGCVQLQPIWLRPCFHLHVLRAFSVPSPCVLRTWKNQTSWNMNECFHARVVRAFSVRSPCSVRIGQLAIFTFADILRIPFYVSMPRSQLSLFETSEKLIELVRLHPSFTTQHWGSTKTSMCRLTHGGPLQKHSICQRHHVSTFCVTDFRSNYSLIDV